MPQHPARAFLLRQLVPEDAPAAVAAVVESQSTVGKWMTWAHANYSEADALGWIAACSTDRESCTTYEFGIFDQESGALVGGAGLNQFNRVNGFCNLGYWVRESWQGRGAASFAVSWLVEYAFKTLGLSRVEIVVALENSASIAVAKKAGATLECTARNRLRLHGRAVNAYVFSLVPTEA